MIALRITARWPTSTPPNSTEPVTSAWEWTRTAGASTERSTLPPETITPAQTIESTARPTRPSSANTNLAGGSGSGRVRIGHCML